MRPLVDIGFEDIAVEGLGIVVGELGIAVEGFGIVVGELGIVVVVFGIAVGFDWDATGAVQV